MTILEHRRNTLSEDIKYLDKLVKSGRDYGVVIAVTKNHRILAKWYDSISSTLKKE